MPLVSLPTNTSSNAPVPFNAPKPLNIYSEPTSAIALNNADLIASSVLAPSLNASVNPLDIELTPAVTCHGIPIDFKPTIPA